MIDFSTRKCIWFLITLHVLWLIGLVATAYGQNAPVIDLESRGRLLYVVHASWCPPCQRFRSDYASIPEFQNKLESSFGVKSCDWNNLSHRRWAQRHGVTSVPAFIVYYNGRCEQVFTGYSGDWKGFLSRLNLEIETEPPQPEKRRSLQKKEITPEERAIPEISNLRSEKVSGNPFSEAEEDVIFPPKQTNQRPPAGPVASRPPDVPPGVTPSENLAKSWGSVVTTAGSVALTLLAPHVALPAGAISIAGLGLQLLRRRLAVAADRRKPVPATGTKEDPIIVPLPQQPTVRTETKYVIQETDIVGEAYKEALRRVASANENRHEVIESLKQVESAASQLLHGQRVVRRPKKDAADNPSEEP